MGLATRSSGTIWMSLETVPCRGKVSSSQPRALVLC